MLISLTVYEFTFTASNSHPTNGSSQQHVELPRGPQQPPPSSSLMPLVILSSPPDDPGIYRLLPFTGDDDCNCPSLRSNLLQIERANPFTASWIPVFSIAETSYYSILCRSASLIPSSSLTFRWLFGTSVLFATRMIEQSIPEKSDTF